LIVFYKVTGLAKQVCNYHKNECSVQIEPHPEREKLSFIKRRANFSACNGKEKKQQKISGKRTIFLPRQGRLLSWVSPRPAPNTPRVVAITGTYDFSTFPNVNGTFVTTGALTISGTTTMDIGPNINGARAHCVVTLIASDGSGTITIHQECAFNTPIPQRRWEIVSGTGAYWNLKGNGPLTMPGNQEAMTGVIY
jgi:hypothetical protein